MALSVPKACRTRLRLRAVEPRLTLFTPSGRPVDLPMTVPSRRKPAAVPDGKVVPVARTKSWVSTVVAGQLLAGHAEDLDRHAAVRVETRSPRVSPGPCAKRTATVMRPRRGEQALRELRAAGPPRPTSSPVDAGGALGVARAHRVVLARLDGTCDCRVIPWMMPSMVFCSSGAGVSISAA